MSQPQPRFQRTLRKEAQISGVAFFCGEDVSVRFLPAEPDTGIVFHRDDLPSSPTVPALIDFVKPALRRTRLELGSASVELTEHVLAALAGLHIDNCHVHLTGPELPGLDGSALPFAQVLLAAGSRMQSATRKAITIEGPIDLTDADGSGSISATPSVFDAYRIGYELDYGRDSVVSQQSYRTAITREAFLRELAAARTFVLESEVPMLQSQGIGRRTKPSDVLVIGADGPLENGYRFPSECARHKALDCLGDFALLGCDLIGDVRASRSGHRLNHEFVRLLRQTIPASRPLRRAA